MMKRRIAKKILRRDMECVSDWLPLEPYSADQFRRALLRVRRDERSPLRRVGHWSPRHWPLGKDRCEECHGDRGGVPGNENITAGRVLCDYCHANAL